MKNNYYVNKHPQLNGDHEVHREDCVYLPQNRQFAGAFSNCKDAVAVAKLSYPTADGCRTCSPDCHTR